jgi:hypothetical protein
MKTVRLIRTGPACSIFDKSLDAGVAFETGSVYEVSESAALDLLRDEPELWSIESVPEVTQPYEAKE